MMKKGGVGGASTLTGLRFETESDLLTFLKSVDGYDAGARDGKAGVAVLFKGKLVARSFKKHKFYDFLKERGVDLETANFQPVASG